MTVRELRNNAYTALRSVDGGGEAAADRRAADWLVSSVLGKSRAQLTTAAEASVPVRLSEKVLRRAAYLRRGWPLQYVAGTIPFHRVELRVDPATLVPRPETEELVEIAVEGLKGTKAPRILDVCTGSGAIALAIKRAVPDSCVDALDVSPSALAIAFENAARLGCEINWIKGDVLRLGWAESLESDCRCRPYDAVVSNPPYVGAAEMLEVDPMVLRYEPTIALEAGVDPVRFYSRIAIEAMGLLRPGGRLIAEIADEQSYAVQGLLREIGYTAVEVRKDTFGKERFAIAVRTD